MYWKDGRIKEMPSLFAPLHIPWGQCLRRIHSERYSVKWGQHLDGSGPSSNRPGYFCHVYFLAPLHRIPDNRQSVTLHEFYVLLQDPASPASCYDLNCPDLSSRTTLSSILCHDISWVFFVLVGPVRILSIPSLSLAEGFPRRRECWVIHSNH